MDELFEVIYKNILDNEYEVKKSIYNAYCLSFGMKFPTLSSIRIIPISLIAIIAFLVKDLGLYPTSYIPLLIYILIMYTFDLIGLVFNIVVKHILLRHEDSPTIPRTTYKFYDTHITLILNESEPIDIDYSKIMNVRYNKAGLIFVLNPFSKQNKIACEQLSTPSVLGFYISSDDQNFEEVLNLLISKLKVKKVRKVIKFKSYEEYSKKTVA